MCDPGLACQLGNCVDLCEGVVCPNGGVCVAGACQDASTGGAGGGSSGGIIITGGSNGMGTGASSNGSGATGATQGRTR